jgi:hypothetical protein
MSGQVNLMPGMTVFVASSGWAEVVGLTSAATGWVTVRWNSTAMDTDVPIRACFVPAIVPDHLETVTMPLLP